MRASFSLPDRIFIRRRGDAEIFFLPRPKGFLLLLMRPFFLCKAIPFTFHSPFPISIHHVCLLIISKRYARAEEDRESFFVGGGDKKRKERVWRGLARSRRRTKKIFLNFKSKKPVVSARTKRDFPRRQYPEAGCMEEEVGEL